MSEQPQIIEDIRWWSVDQPDLETWQLIALIMSALLLAATAAFIYRRKKRATFASVPPNPRNVALEALREAEALLSEEHQRAFAIRVSQILRSYLQDRFHLRALHRSTEEFLREAQHDAPLSPPHQESLGDFLAQCDMVKFAQRGMALPQMEILLQSARAFVEATPQPAPVPAGPS